MTLPPAILLVMLCFGAGWGLDALLGGSGEEAANPGTRIPAMGAAQSGAGHSTLTPADSSSASSAKTLDELLRLADGVLYATGHARAVVAIGQLTDAELSVVCDEWVRRLKTIEPWRLPRQVTNPLLVRWLAVNPLAALRARVEFKTMAGWETEDNSREALKREAQNHPEFIASLGTPSQLPYWWWETCEEVMKDLPPQKALPRLVAMGAYHGGGDELEFSWYGQPERWIAADPHGAMTWALSLPPGTVRNRLLDTMAISWGKEHREDALAFIHALPPSVAPAGLRANLENMATVEVPPDLHPE